MKENDYDLLKVPNEVLIKDLKATIKKLTIEIGSERSYIQELEDKIKRLMALNEKELLEVKRDGLINILNKQNSILGDIVHKYKLNMANLIRKMYEETKVQAHNA